MKPWMMPSTLSVRTLAFSSQCRAPSYIHRLRPTSPFCKARLPATPAPLWPILSWRSFTSSAHSRLSRPPTKVNSYVKSDLQNNKASPAKVTIRENIYTLPNLLTMSRILTCPVLGWSILDSNFHLATGLLVYAGLSDIIDGFLARRFNMRTVLGTILDPAADKTLMTTLTVTLMMKGLLPVSLAAVIIGRDVLLSLSAFYIRYTSLPHPKTFARYWDFSIPSAEVRPTTISKFNTAAQLALMFTTTIAPIGPTYLSAYLPEMQLLVAVTTIWSGLSYVFSKDAVRVLSEARKQRQPPS